MGRRTALVGLLLLGACDPDGTVNNDDIVIPATVRVSLSSAGLEGNSASDGTVHVSADGRRVAFCSRATNLHPDDRDGQADLYVKDMATRSLYLASRADGASGAKATQDTFGGRLSGDGRRVVFATTAPLDPADADSNSDVYVRDLETDRTILVSRAPGASGAKGNQGGSDPDISADGRYVVFQSQSTNLLAADTDLFLDVYMRDLATDTLELLSRATGPAGAKGNLHSTQPRLSADAKRVAFVSSGSNLVSPAPTSAQAYLRDLTTLETRLMSRASGPDGAPASSGVFEVALSADGQFVAFSTFAANLDPLDQNTQQDVYLRDIPAETTELMSRATGPLGRSTGSQSAYASISGDGRFVSFATAASNLGSADENGQMDVYIRDRWRALTLRGSARTFGGELQGHTAFGALSADGRFLVFLSSAPNAVDDDGNGSQDVFLRGALR